MRTVSVTVGLVAALVLAGSALAREAGEKGKGRRKGGQDKGQFVSATLEGEAITWTLKVEDAGEEKSYQMPADVIVLYADRGGQKTVRALGSKGKKTPEPKGKMQVAEGRFVKAEADGDQVAITIKVGEEEQAFSMASKLAVAYRERRGENIARRIKPIGGRRKEKGDAPRKGRRRKKAAQEDAPENM
jgi:hypothetical protein